MTYTEPIVAVLLLVFAVAAYRRSRRLMLLGTLGLLLVSWSPTVWLMSRPLEGWYRFDPPETAGVQAIVLLSGYVTPPRPGQPYSLLSSDTYQRVKYAAWLYHKSGLPVLVCGGYPGPPHLESYAASMKTALVAEGVPAESVWLEERSTSTYENAVFGAEILEARNIRRIAVVTEAFHMLRAEGCFRKQGLDVVPAPTAFRTFDIEFSGFIPSWGGIRYSEQLLHEAVGLVWYRLRGRL